MFGDTYKPGAQRSISREESDNESSDESEMDKWRLEVSDIPDEKNMISYTDFEMK